MPQTESENIIYNEEEETLRDKFLLKKSGLCWKVSHQ